MVIINPHDLRSDHASILCAGSYVAVAKRWTTEGSRVLQVLQLFFVLGAATSPAVTQIFLDRHFKLHNTTKLNIDLFVDNSSKRQSLSGDYKGMISNQDYNDSSMNAVENAESKKLIIHSDLFNNFTSLTLDADIAQSRLTYAFMITGIAAFISAIPIGVCYVLQKTKCLNQDQEKRRVKRTSPRRHARAEMRIVIPVMVLVGIFFWSVAAVEDSFSHFLATFLVQVKGYDNSYQ